LPKTTTRHAPAGQLLAVGLGLLLALAGAPEALAQDAGQRAGQVTAAIPAGWLQRPNFREAAAPELPVLWDDMLTTEARGRARITLDDGSILNVGSDSSLRVVKHDATTRETDLVLTYGQMRVRTRKLTEPGSRFTVNTPTAVLGVIGTDFWVFTDGVRTWVIVFEGALSIAGIGGLGPTNVGPGQQSTVGTNQPPSGPSSPSKTDYNNAINDTNVGPPLPQPPGPRFGGLGPKVPWIVGIAAVAAVVVGSIVVNRNKKEQPPPSRPPESGGRD